MAINTASIFVLEFSLRGILFRKLTEMTFIFLQFWRWNVSRDWELWHWLMGFDVAMSLTVQPEKLLRLWQVLQVNSGVWIIDFVFFCTIAQRCGIFRRYLGREVWRNFHKLVSLCIYRCHWIMMFCYWDTLFTFCAMKNRGNTAKNLIRNMPPASSSTSLICYSHGIWISHTRFLNLLVLFF